MTNDQPIDTTPPSSGADEHEQMLEVHIDWCGTPRETTTERPICRYCWHEGPDGHPRRSDWPCPTVQAQAELSRLQALVAAYRTEAHRWHRHSHINEPGQKFVARVADADCRLCADVEAAAPGSPDGGAVAGDAEERTR